MTLSLDEMAKNRSPQKPPEAKNGPPWYVGHQEADCAARGLEIHFVGISLFVPFAPGLGTKLERNDARQITDGLTDRHSEFAGICSRNRMCLPAVALVPVV